MQFQSSSIMEFVSVQLRKLKVKIATLFGYMKHTHKKRSAQMTKSWNVQLISVAEYVSVYVIARLYNVHRIIYYLVWRAGVQNQIEWKQ